MRRRSNMIHCYTPDRLQVRDNTVQCVVSISHQLISRGNPPANDATTWQDALGLAGPGQWRHVRTILFSSSWALRRQTAKVARIARYDMRGQEEEDQRRGEQKDKT
jgi:hypothetical protein